MKKIFALFIAAIMLVSIFGTTASAEELDTPENNPIVTEEYSRNIYSDVWTLVYTGTGSSVNLTINNYTGWYCDIKMIDYGGDQVWYQYHTVEAGNTGYYYVGSNVKYVYMRGSDGLGIGTVSVTVN